MLESDFNHDNWQLHPRAKTAIHEAGHAIVAQKVGVGIASASIVPDDRTNGRVRLKSCARVPLEDIAIWLAGDAAECLLCNLEFHEINGLSVDWPNARTIATHHFHFPERALSDGAALATKILQENWEVATHFAGALIVEKELTGEQLTAALAARNLGT